MRAVHLGIVGAAVLLALHVVVPGGVDLGHPHVLVTAPSVDQHAHQAPAVDRPTRGQSVTVACLAHACRVATGPRDLARHPPPPPGASTQAAGGAGADATDPTADHPGHLPELVEEPATASRAAVRAREGR